MNFSIFILTLSASRYKINTSQLNKIPYINTTASAELYQCLYDRLKEDSTLKKNALIILYNNMSVCSPSQSMDLSLQAIDFRFASSIQDGWPLSDMDCKADGIGGEDEGDEDGCTILRGPLSSRGLSGTLVGLDSAGKKPSHVAAHGDAVNQYGVSARAIKE